MNDIRIRISCIPPKATKQQGVRIGRRGNKACIISGKKTTWAKAEAELTAMLAPYAPAEPMEGPLMMSIVWRHPYRASEPKRNRTGDIPCHTLPDLDNLCKGVGDILAKLKFFHNDGQIAQLQARKYWSANPGISLVLKPAE